MSSVATAIGDSTAYSNVSAAIAIGDSAAYSNVSAAIADGDSAACGSIRKLKAIKYRFKEGSTVYSIQQANKGIMEPVSIKRLNFNTRFNQIFFLYVDTFNWLWNESELCVEADANALATAYLQTQTQLIQNQLNTCPTTNSGWTRPTIGWAADIPPKAWRR